MKNNINTCMEKVQLEYMTKLLYRIENVRSFFPVHGANLHIFITNLACAYIAHVIECNS